MMINTPKRNPGRAKIFSDNFKVQIALEYFNGDLGYSRLARKYEISKSNVANFVSWYRNEQQSLMNEKPLETAGSPPSAKDRELEKKLALAELKIAALEKVIAIANAEYGTDLKKKAATK